MCTAALRHRPLSAIYPFFQFGAFEFPLLADFVGGHTFILYPLS